MIDFVVFEWTHVGPVIVSSEWVTGTLPRLTRNRASDLFRERAVLSEIGGVCRAGLFLQQIPFNI